MREFDLYWGFVYFDDSDDCKNRPVTVIDLIDDGDYALLAPVYTYRKYFDESDGGRRYYEIQDYIFAGLAKPSYADIRRSDYYEKRHIDIESKIGRLSERDIDGLLEFMERNI
jgi:hypothetical protein